MKLAEAIRAATVSFQRFGYVYMRSMRMATLAHRSTRSDLPRRKRWLARYQLWCLRREVQRDIYKNHEKEEVA